MPEPTDSFHGTLARGERPSAVRTIGIVNVTEDSFSDGGRYLDPVDATAHARRLRADGADVVELGAASSHPDAQPVSVDEERRRLVPILEALAAGGTTVSIDTTRPETQRLVLGYGVAYLNDVRGFPDPGMYEALASSDCRLVVVHSITGGEIATRTDTDPATIWPRIDAFFAERLQALTSAGVARDRLILDPGLGFFLGANAAPSMAVLGGIGRLRARFGVPVLVSPSRKSFLRTLTGRSIPEVGPATLAAELYAARAGVDYIRTHDVRALTDALTVEHALDRHGPSDAIGLVDEWYAQMNAGDIAAATRKLDPQIEWVEAEHSPYGRPGESIFGAAAVSRTVWSRLARDWSDLRFVPHDHLPLPDGVAVLGRYVGTSAGSGSVLDAQVLHLWTVVGGRITRYRGFADTYALHEAMRG